MAKQIFRNTGPVLISGFWIEQNYNVLCTFTFFSGKGRHFYAAVLRGWWVNVNETQVCKQTASTHQFACITAFPCGDGELQQVNVKNTHIVCVI